MSAPIADRKLWDSQGNHCRVEMHKIGADTFEVYFHDFNDAIPTRYVGALGILNNSVDAWLHNKKSVRIGNDENDRRNPRHDSKLSDSFRR